MEAEYQPQQLEKQAQAYWEDNQVFEVKEDLSKEKFYCLSMFPYPSGHLHVGHVRNYTLGDVISRYQRMLGKNVLQPIGWDAFGLPAENAAIKNQVAPAAWTVQNIDVMREQFKRMGLAYDWRRELATCDPDYYRWEQWLFIRMFKKGLVYRKNSVVNWDPVDQTVLANEQVINGRGWRSGALVEQREIPQWFLKITDYADELLNDIDKLEHWPEQVRTMQRNWIGRSEGVEILFPFANDEMDPITVFTTRPDTLFGVTYLAISAQHPLAKLSAKTNPEIAQFIEQIGHTKVAEAELATIEKKGIATNLHVIHPLTGDKIPVWIANFVIMEYGSGAVMSVPAHDQRDFEFAQKYHLPIKQVIKPANDETIDLTQAAFTEYGVLINSGEFENLSSSSAFKEIAEKLQNLKRGRSKVTFRLRDWSISRQRYWGAPIPMIHCNDCGDVPVLEKDLPVVLPTNIEFTGTQSPLKNSPEFLNTTCPECGQPATRETDTFDTFMESSWYYVRFACYNQTKSMLDDRANYWAPVDHYIGGIEHACMHLLYARFIHKVLRDEGLVNSNEPFTRLLTQGMVLKDGSKMSKSKGNTVNPQALFDQYGSDTLRLFLMFAAPPDQNLEWSDQGVEGCYRFLKRVWAFARKHHDEITQYNEMYKGQLTPIEWDEIAKGGTISETGLRNLRNTHKEIHAILKKACHDMEICQFNTIVSANMKLLNLLNEIPSASDLATDENEIADLSKIIQRIITGGFSILLRVLYPITPHITHHLWRELQFGHNIAESTWPKIIKSALKTAEIELVVQVNGKLRGKIVVSSAAERAEIENIALNEPNVNRFIAGKECKKIIIVPGKLVNIVIA